GGAGSGSGRVEGPGTGLGRVALRPALQAYLQGGPPAVAISGDNPTALVRRLSILVSCRGSRRRLDAMLRVMLKGAATLLHRLGLGPDRTWTRLFPADARLEPHLESIVQRVRPFTMTSRQRIRGLCRALAYLERQQIAGAIVECGVWKGGSMMAAA